MSLFLTVREYRTGCSWIKKSEALKGFHLGDVLLLGGVAYLCRHPVSNMDYEVEAYSYLWPLFEVPRLGCQDMWHQDPGISSLHFLGSVMRPLFCQKSEFPKIGSRSVTAPKLIKAAREEMVHASRKRWWPQVPSWKSVTRAKPRTGQGASIPGYQGLHPIQRPESAGLPSSCISCY